MAPPSEEGQLRGNNFPEEGPAPLRPLTVLEGAVDDPLLANPRARHERLGTGWYGVIFEFEGVLVESAHEDHVKAWQEACAAVDKYPPLFMLERAEGMKDEQVVTELLRLSRNPEVVKQIADAKDAAFRRIHGPEAAPEPLPGVLSLMRSLAFHDIPIAVASGARGDRLTEGLQRAGLAEYVAAIISGDSVRAARPDPEPYMAAAYDIQRPPARCVVVGSSNASIEAAMEVGMKVVAVASRLKVYELTAADLVVRQMEELKLQNLQQLFGAEQGREPEYTLEEEVEEARAAPTVVAGDGHGGGYPF